MDKSVPSTGIWDSISRRAEVIEELQCLSQLRDMLALKLLLLRKWGNECREELSQPGIMQSHSWFSWMWWGKPLPRHSTEISFSIFCCPPVFPLTGSSCDPMLEGVRSLLIVSPNHGENKQSHWRELFPSQYCRDAHQIHTPLSWDSHKHLLRTEQKARTGKFGFICFSVPFRELVSG